MGDKCFIIVESVYQPFFGTFATKKTIIKCFSERESADYFIDQYNKSLAHHNKFAEKCNSCMGTRSMRELGEYRLSAKQLARKIKNTSYCENPNIVKTHDSFYCNNKKCIRSSRSVSIKEIACESKYDGDTSFIEQLFLAMV